MKRIFLALSTVLTLTVSHAQEKGAMYVGGNLGINVQSTSVSGNSTSSQGIAFAPEFGYFVANKLKLGASIGYGYTSGSSSHALTIMPNLNYYVSLCDNIFYTPGIEMGLCYTSSRGYGCTGFGIGLQLFSLEIKPRPNLGIAMNLISFSYIGLSDNGEPVNSVSFDLSYNPSIGVRFYF